MEPCRLQNLPKDEPGHLSKFFAFTKQLSSLCWEAKRLRPWIVPIVSARLRRLRDEETGCLSRSAAF